MVASRADVANPFVYSDLAHFPNDNKRREILDGDLIVNPSPYVKHQRISRNLGKILVNHLDKSGQGELLGAPVDVRLGDDVLIPDLLVILEGGLARVTEACVVGAPDLVVEILSKSSRKHDRGGKARAYAREGVREYWILDPDKETLERLVLDGNKFAAKDVFRRETFGTPLMPGLKVDLSKVWPD